MAFSFRLCPQCLAHYRSLVHDPDCDYTLNLMPFCSLKWSDEHPQSAEEMIIDRENHGECAASVLRLVGARTHLWRTGIVPEDLRLLWEQARQAIPNWPGFQRLSLNEVQREDLDACVEEAEHLDRALGSRFSPDDLHR
jgi:hypothetical protein